MKLQNFSSLFLFLTTLLSGCAAEMPRYSDAYKPSLESVVDLNEHLSSLQQLLIDVQNAQSAIEESLNGAQSSSGDEHGQH